MPARRQNGPRSGTHLGTSAATARSAKAEIAESEYCSRFPSDERDRISVLVDHSEITRISGKAPRARSRDRLVHSNNAASRSNEQVGQQLFELHLAETRIADVVVGIGETQLERFEDEVFCLGDVALKNSGYVVSLQDAQSHQDDKTLPVGWHFHDAVASVCCGDGIYPFRVLAGEIGQLQKTTTGIRSRDDFACQLAGVIIVPSMLAELAPSPGQIALAKNFAWLRRLALQQIFLNRMVGHT